MNNAGGSKINLPIQLEAKASLEVQAEIPKESVGRTLDALVDIIRPFTENRGLKADMIRLQREDILIEITKKAIQRAQLEKLQLAPVPNKLLIPFLEKASLEDLDKDMQDHWAALLLSASTHYHARHLTYIDLMSRLSSNELRLLEDIAESVSDFPYLTYPDTHHEMNSSVVNRKVDLINPGISGDLLDATKANKNFIENCKIAYGDIMHTCVWVGNPYYFYTKYGDPKGSKFQSLQILEREGLVEITRAKPHLVQTEVAYFEVTYQGLSFVSQCSPKWHGQGTQLK